MSPLTPQERLLRKMTGGELTQTLVYDAQRLGWLAVHYRPGWNKRGQARTNLLGDAGMPDVILARPPEVGFVEVKREVGDELSDDQERWAAVLRACPGVWWQVVRPSTYQALLERLARPPSSSGRDGIWTV